MASRLSSLLVRDGLVGVKRMENAFQRQVIYGGCLDTILLEMNLLPEERLLQYLSLATGLPPATRSEIDVQDPEAVAKCAVDAARMYRVVPLCLAEGALRVLVHDPVDMGLLEELANDLEFPVQPLVVPEYRFHLTFARTFGGTPNARFIALAKRAEESTPSSPVGRARTIIVEESAPLEPADEDAIDHSVVDVDVPPSRVADEEGLAQRIDAGAARQLAQVVDEDEDEDEEVTRERLGAAPTEPMRLERLAADTSAGHGRAQPRATILGVGLPGAEYFLPSGNDSEPIELTPKKVVTAPMGSRNPPLGNDRVVGTAVATPDDTAPAAEAGVQVLAQVKLVARPVGEATRRAASEPGPAPGRDARAGARAELSSEPLPPAQARAALENADDRDLIFEVLLRAIHHHAWYAGLLTIQGGAAIGRIAIAGDALDREAIGGVLIPLDTVSAFQKVVRSAAPHVGPITTGDPEIDGMIQRMGQVVPPSALLLPVVLRDRVVAIAVGHNRDEPLDVSALPELLPLAQVAAEAILQLLVKTKAQSSKHAPPAQAQPRPASPAPVPPVVVPPAPVVKTEAEPLPPPPEAGREDDDLSPEISVSPMPDTPAAPATSTAPATPTAPATAAAPATMAPEPAESMDTLLDAIEGEDRELAARAKASALGRPGELVRALALRFPGKLVVDRYALGGRTMPAAQHGPLLALVIELGNAAADLLIAKMSDSKREVRYYATLCAEELRPRTAVSALVDRLFDVDYGTRTAAIHALTRYLPEEIDMGLVRARQALHTEDSERVQAAAHALAEIGDIRAIPDLLDAVARDDRASEHARRALIQLTKQDFGMSARKWRAWWQKHKKEHRIEWLIEGLAHKEEHIRRSAVEDLRRLTGEFFGYQYDGPRRDREQGRQRWLDWWNTVGSKRFGRPDERYRDTGVVPGKEV